MIDKNDILKILMRGGKLSPGRGGINAGLHDLVSFKPQGTVAPQQETSKVQTTEKPDDNKKK